MKYKAPHQKAWLVERRNALIKPALQRAESQVSKRSPCISFTTAVGLGTPYQALSGRQPHFRPPLEEGYHADLDVKGPDNFARAREIVAVAIIEDTAEHK